LCRNHLRRSRKDTRCQHRVSSPPTPNRPGADPAGLLDRSRSCCPAPPGSPATSIPRPRASRGQGRQRRRRPRLRRRGLAALPARAGHRHSPPVCRWLHRPSPPREDRAPTGAPHRPTRRRRAIRRWLAGPGGWSPRRSSGTRGQPAVGGDIGVRRAARGACAVRVGLPRSAHRGDRDTGGRLRRLREGRRDALSPPWDNCVCVW
jgi:hypothetical protein